MKILKLKPINLALPFIGLIILTIPVFLYYPDLSYFFTTSLKILITVIFFLTGIFLIIIPLHRILRAKPSHTTGDREVERIDSKNVKVILKNQ